MIGLRCSNALISDETTWDRINHMEVYKSYGINTVSVYFMGSRFGDVKGYRPDASLDRGGVATLFAPLRQLLPDDRSQ